MNEQALKEKLKYIAKKEDSSFNDIWKRLVLERLLVRFSKSEHSNNFIFKGGLLLSYYIEIGRETKDVDFLAQFLNVNEENIVKAFKAISSIDIKDGFQFSYLNISQLDQTHMDYPGYRLKLKITFGKMRDFIQIDIGVGDAVEPKQDSLDLYQCRGKPIFEESVSLQVYPIETIFSEKLETVIFKGAINSRMKDYHDLLLLCRKKRLLKREYLKKSIESTFKYRGSQANFSISFSKEEFSALQKLWGEHIRKLGGVAAGLSLPFEIEAVVYEINSCLKNILISD